MADDTPDNPSFPKSYLQELSLDRHSLAALAENGSCEFELPETMFDAAFPGHFMRKIKSVSIMIRCIAGPRTVVTAELTLISSKTRMSPKTSGILENLHGERDFTASFPSKSKATSGSPNASGIFELNFSAEGYLPFESQGAISRWSLKLPKQQQDFDSSTISDVVIRLSYTARDGGSDH